MRKKIVIGLGIILVVLVTYNIGFSNGQESVYKKAENDKKLQLMRYGG
jgi:hypothetical protein